MSALLRRFAVSHRAATLFRTWLGATVLFELVERLATTLPWLYTDAGAFPRWAVMPPSDEAPALHAACIHAWYGSLTWQYAVFAMQFCAAAALCAGVWPRAAAAVCWVLHVSSMLRNPQLSFIFDRYLHVLLLLATCMPAAGKQQSRTSAASCVLAAQLVLIYVDAGYHKLTSPDAAWSLHAEVSALDTYMRHTPVARFARWLLGAHALRFAGAATAWLELTIAPLALAAPTQGMRRYCIAAAAALHVGIALTMRNTFALSLAAIAAWLPFIDGPPSPRSSSTPNPAEPSTRCAAEGPTTTATARAKEALCACFVCAWAMGSAWHQMGEFGAPACAASGGEAAHLLQSTMLHNRWNVFTGAEPYVVWEVAPARLDDGSIVDLWRGTDTVAWEVPRGAPPASRGGRWRSWPYLAERTPEADDAFWGALCDEWESRDAAGRRVVSFVFYLLQADVVPAGRESVLRADEAWQGYLPEYGAVRKRRIRQFSCLQSSSNGSG